MIETNCDRTQFNCLLGDLNKISIRSYLFAFESQGDSLMRKMVWWFLFQCSVFRVFYLELLKSFLRHPKPSLKPKQFGNAFIEKQSNIRMQAVLYNFLYFKRSNVEHQNLLKSRRKIWFIAANSKPEFEINKHLILFWNLLKCCPPDN